MKKNYCKKLFISLVLLAGLSSVQAQKKEVLIQQKQINSKGDPTMVVFKKTSKYNLAQAQKILLNQINANNISLKTMKIQSDNLNFVHERKQQYYKGIKVEFGQYIFHSQNNIVKSMNGELYDIEREDVTPKISKQAAFQKALSYIGAKNYLWENPKEAKSMDNYKKPEGELVLLPAAFTGKSNTRLAYKYDIYATNPLSRGNLYMDAETGEALFYNAIIKHANNFGHVGESYKEHLKHTKNAKVNKAAKAFETALASGTAQTRYSGTRTIDTRLDGSDYTLNDNSRKVYTRNANNKSSGYINNYTEFKDNDNNWTTAEHSADKDDAALDAHWGAMMTYDYFKQEHNRNSYDDNGAQIRSYVHVNSNYDNAFWNGSVMSYGDGSSNGQEGNGNFDALTSIDVAAHEIGHAVCSSTSNLAYQKESGALNEGFSDIWGAAVEHFAKGNGDDMNPDLSVWLIGDEIDRRSGSQALRSMIDPKSQNQPDTYGGTNWKNPNCFPSQFNDQCGVHTNSGVLNYWFYLLTVGGSGTNDNNDAYSVTGIGMTKAAKISYRLEVNYLSANSTYANARTASIQATTDLYGANSQEVASVTNAWHAVGVGEKFVQTCSLAAPTNLASSNVGDNGFTVSWDAVSGAASYEVTIGSTTTNVSGTSYTASGLISGTEYTVSVAGKCSPDGTGTASNIKVTTTGNPPLNYCASKGNDVSDESIQKVELGSINNSSGAGNGYTDFTTISTEVDKNESYTITITPKWSGTQYNEGYSVWIDYNQDGDFEDSGEQVWTKAASKDSPVSGTFTIPNSAVDGATRMRVSMKYNGIPTSCESFSYGEVEDYSVVIGLGIPDTEAPSTPSNLTASNITTSSVTLNWNASSDNVAVTEYDVYQESVKIASTPSTAFDVSGLTASSTYNFSVRAKDAAGNESEVSNVVTITTSEQQLTYCDAKGNDSSYEWIDKVSFGGMVNQTGNDQGYKDYTDKVATVVIGSTNQLVVSAGFNNSAYNEYWAIFIDYNQDGDFEDSGEKVDTGNSSSAGDITSDITIPTTAVLGNTRMRVTMRYNAEAFACGSFDYGEVEDYTVNITDEGNAFGAAVQSTVVGEDLRSRNIVDFAIYPNPAIEAIQVKLNSRNANASYRILNSIGQSVQSAPITNQKINISKIKSGMYILEVFDGQRTLTTKFVKK